MLILLVKQITSTHKSALNDPQADLFSPGLIQDPEPMQKKDPSTNGTSKNSQARVLGLGGKVLIARGL